MTNFLVTMALLVVAMGVFVWLWREGKFLKVSAYWKDTMDELKKCSWPTWDELTGSTAVVIVSVVMLGGFTILIDVIAAALVKAVV